MENSNNMLKWIVDLLEYMCVCMFVCVYVWVCVLLTTGPKGTFESWGGNIPTSESDRYET